MAGKGRKEGRETRTPDGISIPQTSAFKVLQGIETEKIENLKTRNVTQRAE